MPESWSLVIALLLAVLVGASLPVLFQLFLTLGTARRTIQQLGPRLNAVLGEVQETTGRLNKATTGLDESTQRAMGLLDAAGDLGDSIQKLTHSLRPAVILGTAVGPALAVAVKTMVDRCGAEDGDGAAAAPGQSEMRDNQPNDGAKETTDE